MGNPRPKSNSSRVHPTRDHRRTNLQIECLESRRLLAGLNISIYTDQNTNGTYDVSTDRPAADRIVYIDLDRNGAWDHGEPTARTDKTGTAVFDGLEQGDYWIGLLADEVGSHEGIPIESPNLENGSALDEGGLEADDEASSGREIATDTSWTLTVSGMNDLPLAVTFPLVASLPASPWQNGNLPKDVNGDGRISAIDALQVINYLNTNGAGTLPTSPGNGAGEPDGRTFFPDVNGDGRVSALDALLIINELNSRKEAASGQSGGNANGPTPEGESDLDSGRLATNRADGHQWTDLPNQRRRTNSQIDAELEVLLDQLAQDRKDRI